MMANRGRKARDVTQFGRQVAQRCCRVAFAFFPYPEYTNTEVKLRKAFHGSGRGYTTDSSRRNATFPSYTSKLDAPCEGSC